MSKQLIKAALFTPTPSGWGLPVALIGSPATVKSSLICEVCREVGLPVEVLSPGERGEGAFGVVPVPDKGKNKRTVLTYPAPDWVDNVNPRGVVFIDELNTAAPAYQAALLGLLLERRIGGYYLGRDVRMIGAFNPPENTRNVWELSSALANRLIHIAWQAPTLSEWEAWLLRFDPRQKMEEGDNAELNAELVELEERRVLAAWTDASAHAKAIVTAYLRAQPHHLHVEPAIDDPNSGRAWPSRRSWTFAVCALAGADIHALRATERFALLAGCVGEAAATEFLAWEASQDLPDAAQVLDGSVTWKHEQARVDRTLAVLNGCAALIVGMPAGTAKSKRLEALWCLLQDVTADSSAHDLVIPCLRTLLSAGIRPTTQGGKAGTKVIAALAPALRAAGILQGGV
jgi:MoxR-like ATPase